jgi:selenocysteine lyase/cysteine desulfurase
LVIAIKPHFALAIVPAALFAAWQARAVRPMIAIAGAAAAVDFLASLGEGPSRRARLESAFEALHEHGAARFERLWSGLCAIDCVRVYGPPPGTRRTPTVSFAVGDIPARAVAQWLADRGIFVSHGDFYATTVVERLGEARHGLVRAGCACYTTDDEVDRLVSGVQMLVTGHAS